MTLTEIEYTPAQASMLQYVDEIGAIPETVILQPGQKMHDVYSASEAAVLKGMHILAERYKKLFQRLNPQLDINDYFSIKMLEGEVPGGTVISFEEFLGNGYNLATGELTYNPVSGYEWYNLMNGFAQALFEPPHSLSIKQAADTGADTARLYRQLMKDYLEILLRVTCIEDARHFYVLSWSDNWSNYFDSGKEWWGTFCWTLFDHRNDTIVFIAASTTD